MNSNSASRQPHQPARAQRSAILDDALTQVQEQMRLLEIMNPTYRLSDAISRLLNNTVRQAEYLRRDCLFHSPIHLSFDEREDLSA